MNKLNKNPIIPWVITGITIILLFLQGFNRKTADESVRSNNISEDYITISRSWSSYIENKLCHIKGVSDAKVLPSISVDLSRETKIAVMITFLDSTAPPKSILEEIRLVLTHNILFPIRLNNVAVTDQNGNIIDLSIE